ncbi:7-cyano-7-deazaguanine synthase [Streptomyces stelliscabiei]|uniref:7-cyano-7-deazaguanine synthase in queuosine biosynthesis n=1 Tax=Streptomyces stelliscabiei TaxID=146820 RepID=A0A8I0TRA0_9ACTN|nr:7-cyano-7-deazaguanine synthase [Streptomyces stelliscabiei]KND43905.1 hypothetical protein IQ64_15505 [Streptomyces stelliscabiei]MBE1596736.1 7-cyano-7-deazaguanine synthase in queuosine biosynthesis [Streptomyces stelliscabiei]MDX2514542.1 7-cyano-7-deazaguanine synthase [Streptomyces stelliscabiei]MDX2551243.1 7-cyano-7-deazaguanine synthase [Streptomyces stelliscabiei]MDX2615291.1 7-cyano-7-deazaguanine synthase [Streptomyces stelliscabiei]
MEIPGAHLAADLHFDDAAPVRLRMVAREPLNPPGAAVRGLFAALCATFAGQLSLARTIEIDGPELPLSAMGWLEELRRYLYAVRSYRDGRAVAAYGCFADRSAGPDPSHLDRDDSRTALLFLSGGIDSALSALLLDANGYQVVPVHVTGVNGDVAVSETEERAATRVAGELGLPLTVFDIVSEPPLAELAAGWTTVPPSFPSVNTVPHGRELLLLSAAAWWCESAGTAASVAFGVENSGWSDTFRLNGHSYPRSDTQSERGLTALQRLSSYCQPGMLTLVSPVAGLTEYRKFVDFSRWRPDLLNVCSFCFWGVCCGLCQKCSLYYVIGRSLGSLGPQYRNSPMKLPSEYLVDALRRPLDPRYRERQVALIDIDSAGLWRDGESSLRSLVRKVRPTLLHHRDAWRRDLLRARYNVSLPAKFALKRWG